MKPVQETSRRFLGLHFGAFGSRLRGISESGSSGVFSSARMMFSNFCLNIISIVDDDESIHAATRTLLRSVGYQVQTFASVDLFLDSGALLETECLILERRAELNDWLAHKVRPMFDQRVLQITEDIMLKWRLLVEEGRKTGHTFSQPDLIIGATALHHGFTVVTRD
jgi:predicted nucleic acid-binding protein